MLTHVKNLIAWDGALPLVIVVLSVLVNSVAPRHEFVGLGITILSPLLAALIRTGIGSEQIRRQCEGRLPLGRQVVLAMAIVLVLLFEGLTTALCLADGSPHSAWLVAAALYACYLLVIGVALAPRARGTSVLETCD